MGAKIHGSLYEKALDELEQIVNEDPDFENEQDEEFIEELSQSSLGGFTSSQAKRINRLYRKYVAGESQQEDDEEDY
jgi:hypothetical protein